MNGGKIRMEMRPVNRIVSRLGIDPNGTVQRKITQNINHRITRYMPYLTGTLATRLKRVASPTEIEVAGPYAKYQYYGKAMVGKAPKRLTGRALEYTKTKNAQAGPFWDRRLMAAEGDAIVADLQRDVRGR